MDVHIHRSYYAHGMQIKQSLLDKGKRWPHTNKNQGLQDVLGSSLRLTRHCLTAACKVLNCLSLSTKTVSFKKYFE